MRFRYREKDYWKSHPGKGASVVVKKEAKKPSGSIVDKSSGTGKVPGSNEVTVGSKDLSSLSLQGIPLLDNPNVQKFIFVLLQMMLQMSLEASQNVSVAAATGGGC